MGRREKTKQQQQTPGQKNTNMEHAGLLAYEIVSMNRLSRYPCVAKLRALGKRAPNEFPRGTTTGNLSGRLPWAKTLVNEFGEFTP